MNVRIFWVRAMKCMCAQTRPQFILASQRVFWGMEFEPMLTPREKSPLPENFPRGGSNPRRCGQRAQTLPTSYSGPRCLPPIKYFGLLISVTWPVYRNINAKEFSFGVSLKGFTSLLYVRKEGKRFYKLVVSVSRDLHLFCKFGKRENLSINWWCQSQGIYISSVSSERGKTFL